MAATGSPLPSARDRANDLILAYFHGGAKIDGGLDGQERLRLARLQLDRGLWNERPFAGGVGFLCNPGPASTHEWHDLAANAARFAGLAILKKHLPGEVWRWGDDGFNSGAKARQIARLIEQFALHFDWAASELPAELPEALVAYLDALPVGPLDPITERKPRPPSGRSRLDLRMMDLFEEWLVAKKPSGQTAAEFRRAVSAFIDFIGDIPVIEVECDDLLNFRDAVARLPVAMSAVDRRLSFTAQVAKFSESNGQQVELVKGATVKKKIGAIQALISFAAFERWIKQNVGRDIAIRGYSKASRTSRRSFDAESLVALFSSPLFLQPSNWNWDLRTTDCTIFWLFLLSATSGARIEELGQALLRDVKFSGDIVYIDIDDYVADELAAGSDATKSVKTANSRRLVPIHRNVLALHFVAYCDALRTLGHTRLFPDLPPNSLGKRTQNASRRVNGVIDKLIDRDPRFVFHSFRHGFGDLASEVGIADRVIDQIRGHAPTTVAGRYGQGIRLAPLNRFFHKICWAFLRWDDLTTATSTIDWTVVANHHTRRASR